MTDQELIEIENRLKSVTPGQWFSFIEGRDHTSGDSFIMTGIDNPQNINQASRGPDIYLSGATLEDQDFIAAARQDVPKLISEINRLKDEINMLMNSG